MRTVSSKVEPKGKFSQLLKGSDLVAAKKKGITGVILQVRDAPANFGAPFIIDFDTEVMKGISSWPLNITQARKLQDMLGDDMDNWPGCAVALGLTMANNPKLNKDVPSLVVTAVLNAREAAKKRTSKPTLRVQSGNQTTSGSTYGLDDVPF